MRATTPHVLRVVTSKCRGASEISGIYKKGLFPQGELVGSNRQNFEYNRDYKSHISRTCIVNNWLNLGSAHSQ